MSGKPFTVSRALAKELRRIDEKMARDGGTAHHIVVQEWHDDMARELKRMVAAYDGSARRAKELLEGFLIAEAEGVRGVAELRRTLAGKLSKRKAA